MMCLIFTVIDLFSKAQIALLRKELSEKEMSKYEVDILRIFATQVQQRLQRLEEKEEQQQLKKQELLKKKMEQQQHKEHQLPHFDGEAEFLQHQQGKE